MHTASSGGTDVKARIVAVLRVYIGACTCTTQDCELGAFARSLPTFPPDAKPELLFDTQSPARRSLHMASLTWRAPKGRNPAPALVRRLQGGREVRRRRQIRKMRLQRMRIEQ